jgi:hypothetical protein
MPQSTTAHRLCRAARFAGAALLALSCAPATGGVADAPTQSPQQLATAANDIRPAMDLLLAPLDPIFANGFE